MDFFFLLLTVTKETHPVQNSPCHVLDMKWIHPEYKSGMMALTCHGWCCVGAVHYNSGIWLICLYQTTLLISEWETKCKSVLQHSTTSYIQSSQICHFSVESGWEEESKSKSECWLGRSTTRQETSCVQIFIKTRWNIYSRGEF